MLSEKADWEPLSLFGLLLVLAVVSEAFKLETKRFKVSASFLTIVLAMTLMGPTPAALLGVLAMLFSSASKRSPWQFWLANLSTYACFPLIGGAVFEAIGGPALPGTESAIYILLVFSLFLVTNVLNFLLIAVDFKLTEGMSIRTSCGRSTSRHAGRVRDRPPDRRRRLRLPGREPLA